MPDVEERWFDARTGLQELSEEECFELLRATHIGRLAVAVGTVPDIFPVHYRVHEGEIAIRTEAGSKLAAATMMPEVAFEIEVEDAIAELRDSDPTVLVLGSSHARTCLRFCRTSTTSWRCRSRPPSSCSRPRRFTTT